MPLTVVLLTLDVEPSRDWRCCPGGVGSDEKSLAGHSDSRSLLASSRIESISSFGRLKRVLRKRGQPRTGVMMRDGCSSVYCIVPLMFLFSGPRPAKYQLGTFLHPFAGITTGRCGDCLGSRLTVSLRHAFFPIDARVPCKRVSNRASQPLLPKYSTAAASFSCRPERHVSVVGVVPRISVDRSAPRIPSLLRAVEQVACTLARRKDQPVVPVDSSALL